jgi:hypothetical protein
MIQSTLPLLQPPRFCQYAAGPCDQHFETIDTSRGLFLYASRPPQIAATIAAAVSMLNERTEGRWLTWKDMDVGGRLIFCEICKTIRGTNTVFADVTTLNFNLLFEIGFCIGLGVTVRPIRDTNYVLDKKVFDELGLLDTLGYDDFINSKALVNAVMKARDDVPMNTPTKTYRDTPLFVLRGPVETEGAVRLFSALKKSPLRFRAHDPIETPRLSLPLALKHVRGSFGVIGHLLSPNREGALAHNALCALICGMALADQKPVLMLQEEGAEQPIDYRDIVQTYTSPNQIPRLLEGTVNQIITYMQEATPAPGSSHGGLLERLDLGDAAAENEIGGLREYYVPTGQFTTAKRGHARLVIGRKGAGKSALFYAIRNAAKRGHESLVLDLKPEGHQFTRLREAVFEELTDGQQEYTIAAFWTYLLSAEIAHKILWNPGEQRFAERDPERFGRYEALKRAYQAHGLASGDDLPQRLLTQVDRLAARVGSAGPVSARTDLAELVYGGDIRTLNDAVAEYLGHDKEAVWLLIDNLDKSWATRGSTTEDMLIIRGLLDATVSLERQLGKRGVTFRPLVFIRPDIYRHLVGETPDRGKDSSISLDWDDPEIFREIIMRRITVSTGLKGDFLSVWQKLIVPTIGTEDSFNYMLDRTLMRPRDLLMFVQRAVEVAINRGHAVVTAEDLRQAESGYSEDLLLGLGYEVDDTRANLSDALYGFYGAPTSMDREEVIGRLEKAGISVDMVDETLSHLLWFGFIGVAIGDTADVQYAYGVRFNVRRLENALRTGTGRAVVHRAFRAALGIDDTVAGGE